LQAASRWAAPVQKLFHGDDGVFAWFADDEMTVTLTDHLNAMHNLFRSPVVLTGTQVDLTIAFGVENGSDRSIANRLRSALVAAGGSRGPWIAQEGVRPPPGSKRRRGAVAA
jgi:hypothetical protein